MMRFLYCILIVGFAFAAPAAHAAPASYFDMREVRSTDISPFVKWTGELSRFRDQRAAAAGSECGKTRFYPCSVAEWKAMLASLTGKPLRQQVEDVNSWGNEHPYIEDQINWGLADYWETPYEFMEINGDCEDYAISKYYSLRALGVPAERLRIIVLQDLNLGGIIHAVLGVYQDGQLLILDNQSRQVLPAQKIYHYRPVFGINEDAWWAYYPNKS